MTQQAQAQATADEGQAWLQAVLEAIPSRTS
jgi:hypothetical protein